MFQRNKLAIAVASAVGIGAVGISVPAFAQDDSAELEEVIVTGSRIKRADLSSVTPVSVVTGEEFKISGNLNVEQKLAELPQTLPNFGPSSNNPGDGTARVDLRGLGSFRTLVLVNGRRYIPATQSGVVDLNTIPGTLIKQVDVTTGGASAVYGSDALAGVVNFQLVDDFQGAEFTALYDVASEGDGEKINFDFTIGGNFDDGRGNAVIYGSVSDRAAVFSDARDFSSVSLGDNGAGQLVPGGSSGVPGTRVFGGPTLPNGETLGIFNADGSGRAWREPQDRFNYAPDNFLQLPQERYLVTAMAHYDLTDNARVYSELTYVRNEVPQELAPTPAFLSSLEVNPDSPFFGADVQSALNGIRTDTNGDGVVNGDDNAFLGFIGRRMVENGSRQAIDVRDANRILLGVDGDINDDWSYDAFYSRATLDQSNILNNDVSDSRFRQAVLVTDAGACQDASGGCAPLNIFGPGNISQAAIDFVNIGATNVTGIVQEVIQGSVSGTLGSLPGSDNPIGVVVGVEYRKDESIFRPDTFLSSGDVLGFNAGNPTEGKYDSTDLFTEIAVPITDQFDFWGAYRYSDYSNIGGVSSFATALSFKPTDMATLRLGFQRAVRAPNIAELFSGGGNGFPGASDPCSVGGFVPGVTDAALCAASGVPASQVGVFTQSNGQIEGSFGGNVNLEEETGDTFTLGAIFQPSDNLDITLDYFSIEIEDAISVLGGNVDNVLDICFNQVKDASSAFCQAVTRRPNGDVALVNVLNENIASIETSGVDLAINYNTDLGFGIGGNDSTLSVGVKGTYLLDFDVTPVAELPDVNKCAGNHGNSCGSPLNEVLINTRVTWDSGPWSISGLLRYLSAVDDDSIENDGVDASTLAAPEIKAEIYLDLAASYDFSDDFSVTFGVNNILDTDPTPQDNNLVEQSNTYPSTYDLLGPRVFMSASYRFR